MKPCPICDGPGGKERQMGEQCLLRCRACGFVYAGASEQEIEQVNFGFFDAAAKSHYREVQSSVDHLWFDSIGARLTQGREGLRVLDIGCGNGVLLRQFKKRGCVCYGSDPSPWASEYAQEYGYTLVPRIEEADIAPGFFDIVTSTSTLEHIARPLEHLRRIVTLIKQGGIAYFTVPNYGSLPIRLRIVKGRLVDPPGHCNYFTARTLKNLFGAEGLGEHMAKVKVRSYGIPESYAVYSMFSKRRSGASRKAQSGKPRHVRLKKALVSVFYWSGTAFGLGDKLEAWIQKK